MRNILLKNIAWGLGHLWWYALAVLLIALALYTLDGTNAAKQHPPDLAAAALFYATAAAAGGVILGLSRPMTRTQLGKALAGFLTALPIVFVLIFQNPFDEPVPTNGFTVGFAIFMAALFGAAGAAYIEMRKRLP